MRRYQEEYRGWEDYERRHRQQQHPQDRGQHERQTHYREPQRQQERRQQQQQDWLRPRQQQQHWEPQHSLPQHRWDYTLPEHHEPDLNREQRDFEWSRQRAHRHPHYDDMHRRPDEWDRRHEDARPMYPFGQYQPREEDFNSLYETTNYYGIPRNEDYGRPHAHRDYGHDWIRESPNRSDLAGRRGYWSMKYEDFDLPNENNDASLSRSPDNMGNHGYRHDPAYGRSDDLWGD